MAMNDSDTPAPVVDITKAAEDEAGTALAAKIGAPGDVKTDPFALAEAWLAEAQKTEPNDPNAMALATADTQGLPNIRMVLLKEIEPVGSQPCGRGAFVFYTNYDSAKGHELAVNSQAALVLHWKSLRRQIRVRGRIQKISAEQSDAYYRSRAYGSRLGAWASQQSQPLNSRANLAKEVLTVAARYPFSPPRPPHWGGYQLIPSEIEFWSDGAFRLHDRWQRCWNGQDWDLTRLYP